MYFHCYAVSQQNHSKKCFFLSSRKRLYNMFHFFVNFSIENKKTLMIYSSTQYVKNYQQENNKTQAVRRQLCIVISFTNVIFCLNDLLFNFNLQLHFLWKFFHRSSPLSSICFSKYFQLFFQTIIHLLSQQVVLLYQILHT